MRKYKTYNIIIGLLFICNIWLTGCEKKIEPPKVIVPSVVYIKLAPSSITLTTELSGRTSAYIVSDVRPQVSGIIQERLFVEGADVKAGDVLYQIDPSLYQAAYNNANAALMEAEANEISTKLLSERYSKIVGINAVSKQEYDNAVAAYAQAKAQVAAAKAALESASINLDYTKVISPVSGRIGRSSITPGALVTQNQPEPLAKVQRLDPMYVDVTQSSTEWLRLKNALATGSLKSSGEGAMQATLKLENGNLYTQRIPKKKPDTGEIIKDSDSNIEYEMKPIIGELKFSDVTVEQSTGVISIRAVFPNQNGILLPGMYVRAIIEEGINEDAILIPQKAVIKDNRGRATVFILTKNSPAQDSEEAYIVEQRILTIDRSVDNQWLISEGLSPDELLVVEGILNIRPGLSVKGSQQAEKSVDSVAGNMPTVKE